MRKICFITTLVFISSCLEHERLVQFSVKEKVSISEVTSMGRDDEDGKAKKWHIGGGED